MGISKSTLTISMQLLPKTKPSKLLTKVDNLIIEVIIDDSKYFWKFDPKIDTLCDPENFNI